MNGRLKNESQLLLELTSLRKFYFEFFELFDLILFNSELTKETYSKHIPLEGKRCQILPIAHSEIYDKRSLVQYSVWKDGKVNILFLGRDGVDKGLPYLFDVLSALRCKRENFRLIIGGEINEKRYRADFVQYIGRYTHGDLPEIFSEASLLIFPSLCLETFGFVGLEALVHGIPVLVTENVGMKMLIKDGVNGFIVRAQDLGSFLDKLLGNPSVLFTIRENILKARPVYTFQQHVSDLENIYRGVLSFDLQHRRGVPSKESE